MEDRHLIELAQSGDEAAMDELMNKHSRLVWSVVKRFMGRGTDRDDLYQIGALGFIKCVRRFDLSYDVKLSTYAVPMILGELKAFFRSDGLVKVSRTLKENYVKLAAVMDGDSVSLKEAATKLGINYDDAVLALEAARSVESLDSVVGDEGGTTVIERLIVSDNQEERLINKMELDRVFKQLPEKSRQIIKMRYFENKTQSYVASKLGISQVQVSRTEKKILKFMREKMS